MPIITVWETPLPRTGKRLKILPEGAVKRQRRAIPTPQTGTRIPLNLKIAEKPQKAPINAAIIKKAATNQRGDFGKAIACARNENSPVTVAKERPRYKSTARDKICRKKPPAKVLSRLSRRREYFEKNSTSSPRIKIAKTPAPRAEITPEPPAAWVTFSGAFVKIRYNERFNARHATSKGFKNPFGLKKVIISILSFPLSADMRLFFVVLWL